MRQILYVTAGLLAGYLGFTLSQLLIVFTPLQSLARPEFVLFPLNSALLAVATVLAEVLLNNPTRFKLNREKLPKLIGLALAIGIASGLIGALLARIVSDVISETWVAKAFGWLFMGLGAGLADGFSWRFRTVEGKQSQGRLKKRAQQRLYSSIGIGLFAGGAAFAISRFVVPPQWEEIVGFLILGAGLGLLLERVGAGVLSFALRAGSGLEALPYEEFHHPPTDSETLPTPWPRIEHPDLWLNCHSPNAEDQDGQLIGGFETMIEEGMSIGLPQKGDITIGSGEDVHIFIYELPAKSATIHLDRRQASVTAHVKNSVSVGTKKLRAGKSEPLQHNQVLTLLIDSKKQKLSDIDHKFVRFVFYDRFLDPQG